MRAQFVGKGPGGVRFTAIAAPCEKFGKAAIGMLRGRPSDWVTPEAERQIEAAQSLPDRLMPADIARIVLWLAADDSEMCTGQKWVVDAGWI